MSGLRTFKTKATDLLSQVKTKKSKMEFPHNLKGFGYQFTKEGKLRHIDTNEPFEFVVRKDDHQFNQANYDALGEVITQEIYSLLESKCNLQKMPVPVNPRKDEATTFIFTSPDFMTADKSLILIHGSGVVRAGQWARRLIINDTLASGTQIPFIKKGLAENYGILIMNTNDNFSNKKKIRGSETPMDHAQYVWKNYVMKANASKVAVIAHSYGGAVATELFQKFEKDFKRRVFAMALTDSVHYLNPKQNFQYLKQIGRNWVADDQTLDTPVRRAKDIPCVSAGCAQHEMTSWSSFHSIFAFIKQCLCERMGTPAEETSPAKDSQGAARKSTLLEESASKSTVMEELAQSTITVSTNAEETTNSDDHMSQDEKH